MNSNETLDYAVVGGGIAGVYTAWRLIQTRGPDGRPPVVALFESSDALGGRLCSVIPPLIRNARVELGGMRYIKDAQPLITKLVDHLQLATEDLAADQPQNIAYVRGRVLRQFELTDASRVPYALGPNDCSVEDLGNLTAVAAMRILRQTISDLLGKQIDHWTDLTKLTGAEWKKVAEEGTWEGVPLSTLPMRYLMLQAISHEAWNLAQDTGGYDSILHTWNGADGFSWNVGDYGPTVKYLHVKDGYEAVPLALARLYREAGGGVYLNSRMSGFDVPDPEGPVTLTVHGEDGSRQIKARRLILAMPRRSLEMLDQTGHVLDPAHVQVHELIRSVTPIPLFKLAICYTSAWWEDLPPVVPGHGAPVRITAGKSVTDLPVRQCYYWKVNPENGHAVILIYDDGVALDYWANLRDTAGTPFPHDRDVLAAEFDLPDWSRFPAPKQMVREVHRQLVELHGDPPNVPEPYTAAYRDWGEDPYGGGANFWPVGVKSYEVAEKILQPRPPYPVYVCGEAYSHAQGWVEGSLQTAEGVLQTHLGVPAPQWTEDSTLKGIDHLNVVTRDLPGTAAFFVDHFGFVAGSAVTLKGAWVDKITGYTDAEATYLPLSLGSNADATRIALLEYGNPPTPAPPATNPQLNEPGYRHIGFVVGDIDAAYERLKGDWTFFSPPVTVEAMKQKTVYFIGPESIVIQLSQHI